MLRHLAQKTLRASDGCAIYYEHDTALMPGKTTLLFLHGLGGEISAWSSIHTLLKEYTQQSILIDIRGHGRSDRLEKRIQYSMERFTLDIKELIAKENLTHVVLIGHCFGGMIAMNYAAVFPQHVEKLILIDAGYTSPYFGAFVNKIPLFHRMMHAIFPFMPACHYKAIRNFTCFVGGSDWDWRRIMEDIKYTSLKSYLMCADTMFHLDVVDVLKKIVVSTLIIEGDNDTIVPPNIARTLHRKIKFSDLKIVQHANHIIVISNPENIANEIRLFIA